MCGAASLMFKPGSANNSSYGHGADEVGDDLCAGAGHGADHADHRRRRRRLV